MKGLYQKGNHGWWYYQAPTIKGQPRPKAIALGTQDELDAIKRVVESEYKGQTIQAETRDTLAEVLPKYYADKGESEKASRRTRRLVLDAFKDVLGNPRVKDINRAMLLDWRARLKRSGGTLTSTKGVGDITRASYLIIVRAFFKWCVKQKIIRDDPSQGFAKEARLVTTRRQDFLSIPQREALLAEPCHDYLGLILHLGFFAGLRYGEMLACHPGWFYIAPDRSYGTLKVRPVDVVYDDGSKGTWTPKSERGIRDIPLHPRLMAFLSGYQLRQPWLLKPENPTFPGDDKSSLRFDPKKALANHAKKCGIDHIGYHMLRHSFATHLAMAGMKMASIAGLLGNEVGVTERNYAGFSKQNNHLLAEL
jgi:integrase